MVLSLPLVYLYETRSANTHFVCDWDTHFARGPSHQDRVADPNESQSFEAAQTKIEPAELFVLNPINAELRESVLNMSLV